MLTSRRVEVPQSNYPMNKALYELGWTDGLPVVPPTEDLVQAFVDYVGRDPSDVIAEIPPARGIATVEAVAANAVMAGCLPEYMPVLLAAIDAVMQPEFNLDGIQCTTNPAAPLLIVNGPIRDRLDINCRSNALGQGWRANATIGRALRLLLVNIGGATPGSVDKATQGQPGKFGMCLGENEEESPWEPLHVERGLSPEQSAVTAVGATGTFNLLGWTRDIDRILTVFAHSISAMGSNHYMGSGAGTDGEFLIILCPAHAKAFAEEGLSKQDVKRILWQRGRLPIDWFHSKDAEAKRAAGAVVDGMALLVRKPENIVIAVAGGPGGVHSTFVPTFAPNTQAATRPIQLKA